MSLYCFGKLKLLPASNLASAFPTQVHCRPDIDPCDAEVIDKIAELAGNGGFFTISDDGRSTDATSLWNDMMSASQDLDSRLARAVHTLLFSPHISCGGIAFVDGGIESILKGTPEQCWAWFLERSRKPWDTIDNPLLVWSACGTP